MTIETLFAVLTLYRRVLLITLAAIPAIAFAISWMHGVYQGREAPWRHLYALLVHAATMVFASLVALLAFYVYQGSSLFEEGVPRVVAIVATISWIFTLLFVKRVVDFEYVRSIRSPFMLLVSWWLAWIAGFVISVLDLAIIPGPTHWTVLAGIVSAFLLLRVVSRAVARER